MRESLATALTGPGLPQFLARANLEARPAQSCAMADGHGEGSCFFKEGKCECSSLMWWA